MAYKGVPEDEDGDVLCVAESALLAHERLNVDHEHGCCFVTCLGCGRQWAVHHVSGPHAYDFEMISAGDESCS